MEKIMFRIIIFLYCFQVQVFASNFMSSISGVEGPVASSSNSAPVASSSDTPTSLPGYVVDSVQSISGRGYSWSEPSINNEQSINKKPERKVIKISKQKRRLINNVLNKITVSNQANFPKDAIIVLLAGLSDEELGKELSFFQKAKFTTDRFMGLFTTKSVYNEDFQVPFYEAFNQLFIGGTRGDFIVDALEKLIIIPPKKLTFKYIRNVERLRGILLLHLGNPNDPMYGQAITKKLLECPVENINDEVIDKISKTLEEMKGEKLELTSIGVIINNVIKKSSDNSDHAEERVTTLEESMDKV